MNAIAHALIKTFVYLLLLVAIIPNPKLNEKLTTYHLYDKRLFRQCKKTV